MKKYFAYSIVAFLFGAIAHAEPGVLPQKVIDAAASVLRVVPLKLGASGDPSSAEQRALKLKTDCLSPKHFITQLRCEYMRNQCPALGECRIPFTTSGTAFLTGNGDELVSAFHVLGSNELLGLTFFNRSLLNASPKEREAVYQAYRPQFLLFDSDGQKVYDTRDYPEDSTRFKSVGDPLRGFAPEDPRGVPSALAGFAYDFAIVKLRKSLGQGLKGKPPGSADSVFWALGYPMRTEGRAVNYDGFRIFANQGERYDMKRAAKDFGFESNPTTEAFPLLYFGNDIVEGFSGGPLFNEEGDVIGIVSATLSDEKEFRGASFAVPWRSFAEFELNQVGTAVP